MRQLLFTLLFISSSILSFSCDITVQGPIEFCSAPNQTGVYEISLNGTGWFCGNFIEIRVPSGGEILNVVDENGNLLTMGPPSNEFSGQGVNFPIFVSIEWQEHGCHQIDLFGGSASGVLWCGCTTQNTVPVKVGEADPVSDIRLTSGDIARACSTIKFEAVGPDIDCATGYRWEIKGEVIETEDNCLSYFLEECPLGTVSVQMLTNCDVTAQYSEAFECRSSPPPPLLYPTSICIGNRWSLTVPGKNVEFDIITSSGNKIRFGPGPNGIYFDATSPGWVIITISYEFCGQRYTRTIFVNVKVCGGLGEDKGEAQERTAVDDSGNTSEAQYKIYPNPATDILNVATNSSDYQVSIFNLNGQLIKQVTQQAYSTTIIVSDLSAGSYFAVIKDANGISSQKFVKQ